MFYLSVFIILIDVFVLCVTFFVLIRELHNYMWVCFHFTAFVSQPSELFQEGQPLDFQNRYGEF